MKIPVFEKFGTRPKPVVNKGDYIKRYQLIAKAPEGFSAPLHSPVSGIVEYIGSLAQVDDMEALTIVIRSDGRDQEQPAPLKKISNDNIEDILQLIEDAGIVGMGGAQFPTAMKYNRKDKKVNTFIVNGVECEPYITSDYALMSYYTEEVLEAILIIDKILDAGEVVIAVENVNKDLEEVFGKYLNKEKYKKISIKIVPDEYPQGGELQLAKTIAGVEIKKGDIPLDHGVVVSNVGTVHAVYNAVVHNRPLVERIITVSGEHAPYPGNYLVKIGTPVSHILKQCGINPEITSVIAGGPMMSPHVRNFSVPLHKGSLGLVALPKRTVDRLPCIWCGYCADVCPMKLMPMKYYQFYKRANYKKLESYNINDCIECGACEYICPARVPLIESIKEGKAKLKAIKYVSFDKTI